MGVKELIHFMNKKEIQRFQKKIELDILSGCWLWNACINSSGYAQFYFRGVVDEAHRISYQYWNGKIPEGLEIDHLCRNRRCVNPAHLEAVTHQINSIRGSFNNNWNSKKTHCPQGHEYTPENLVTSELKLGNRKCKICVNNRVRQYCRRPEVKLHVSTYRKQLRSGLIRAS